MRSRFYDKAKRAYEDEALGVKADDMLDPNGTTILSYAQAQKKLRERYAEREKAAATPEPEKPYTVRDGDYVFPSVRLGRPLGKNALLDERDQMGYREQLTPHGVARSTFRDFVGDETEFAREIAEAALAHKIGNPSEQSYRRRTAIKKRTVLMQQWGDYVDHPPVTGDNVVTLKR